MFLKYYKPYYKYYLPVEKQIYSIYKKMLVWWLCLSMKDLQQNLTTEF